MRKIGFIISKKENELRRAITFEDLINLDYKEYLYFEKGYFKNFGYKDEELVEHGIHIAEYDEIIKFCDVIIEPKIGDSDNLDMMKNKIIFGWIHATQNYNITQSIIDNHITAIAFEKMYDGKRHLFEKNNQIAGYAAIFHSMLCYGKSYENLKVAILGNGNTAKGAMKALKKIGADITLYKRSEEDKFRSEMFQYDVIVNAILWDVNRQDHIIYKNDLKYFKKNSIIVDISCDKNGGIETSIPTTVDQPTYQVEGIMHYVVDHTPTFLYKDATISISEVVISYIKQLVEESQLKDIFDDALIIVNGVIKDEEIIKYQNR